MTKLVVHLVLVALVTVALVPAVPAPPSAYAVDVGGGNWSAVVFSAPVSCTSAKLSASWQAGQPAASALVYLFGGSQVFNYAMYWEEGNNVWLKVSGPGGSLADVGTYASTPGGHAISNLDLGAALCRGTFTRAALVVPGAASARVDFTLADAPAVAATMGGADAFGLFGRDFAGTKVDAGTFGPGGGLNPGANAVAYATATRNLDEGLLGVFLPLRVQYAGLRVEGPNGILADADCAGYFFSAACLSYGYVGGLGFGNDAVAPAGDYDFTIRYQAGAEHHRIAAVGAPVDWCDVGPACPVLSP